MKRQQYLDKSREGAAWGMLGERKGKVAARWKEVEEGDKQRKLREEGGERWEKKG